MNNKRLSVFAVALTMILLLLSVSCVNSAKVKLPSPTEGQVRRWQSDTIDFIGTEFDYLYDYDLILTAIFE